MPSFGRIGKHSNRSQHNLVEQQQQQLQIQQQQQQQQQQQHHHRHTHTHTHSHQQRPSQTNVSGGVGAAAAGGGVGVGGPAQPPTQTAASTSASGSGPGPTSASTSSQQTQGGHRVSAAGTARESNTPSSASSSGPVATALGINSSSDSFQHQHPHQQGLQGLQGPQQAATHPSAHPQGHHQAPLSVSLARSLPPPPPLHPPQQGQQTQSLPTPQQPPPPPLQHPQQQQQQQPQPQPLNNSSQQQQQPPPPPPPHQQPQQYPQHQQHSPSHRAGSQSSLPLNPASSAYTARQQPHDNFAELVSRSHSARFSQHLPHLQTQLPFGATAVASTSVDDLSQTTGNSHINSPIVTAPPALPHSQTVPAENNSNGSSSSSSKRSNARKLIKNILSVSSSSRPASDPYTQEPQYESSPTVGRRNSKRSSNPQSGRSLLSRPVNHPDWVPPPKSDLRRTANQSRSQPKSVGDLDNPHLAGLSNQEIYLQASQDTLQNTIRQVPSDIDTSPYDQEELAYQQQQAIAHHQAQIFQAQQQEAQAQAEQQQQQQQQQHQLYGQIVIDPAQNQYQYTQPHEQYQLDNGSSVYVGHLNTDSSQLPNPETISQLSHESPTPESEQAKAQSARESLAVIPAPHDSHSHSHSPSQASPQTAADNPNMAGTTQGRRSGENEKAPPGPPSGFRHSQGPMPSLNTLPPTPGVSGAPPSFRTSGVQGQQYEGANQEDRGRNSPQPPAGDREADPDKQFKDLLTKYKNVKRLYFDGKTQIEQLGSQVEQLQNAVANQRLSSSRTALDDNEYSTRFNRLNGAVNNLAFNIRKDWRSLPGWIEKFVSPEALKTGKQEMTAVGRAVIVRWIMDEIFNKCFHPGLDMNLSCHLKEIEQNIRRFSYTLNSQEEFDALTSKVVNWRMATLEGLQHMLNSPESADYRNDFTKMATSNLTATLYQFLSDPPPAGVDGSASMIVELAVGIAANLPLESRDVALTYPLPGDVIQPDIMEPEKSGLPPLPDPVDEAEENAKENDKSTKREKTKSGMLNMLGGTQYPGSRKGSTASILTDTASTAAAAAAAAAAPPPKDPSRVRFAGFLALEVRGRQVLMKAPVWTLG
ncbi:hypothetical protein F4780DRAFT_769939 [Xylariomycetidae sp. FL0641]|nr:hypothetical protein F4780DRAFT_769939 [Xylariomycetidae sp. FL0641]